MKPTRKLSLPPAASRRRKKSCNCATSIKPISSKRTAKAAIACREFRPASNWSLLVPANELEFANFYHL